VIEVIVSRDGRVLGRFDFDEETIVHHCGGLICLHGGAMRESPSPAGLWRRLAHAAGYLAEKEGLENVQALERLLMAGRSTSHMSPLIARYRQVA
jgi:hypothetical protein